MNLSPALNGYSDDADCIKRWSSAGKNAHNPQPKVGAIIGGAINLAVHWDKIHNFQDGAFAFWIGAVAGGAYPFGQGILTWSMFQLNFLDSCNLEAARLAFLQAMKEVIPVFFEARRMVLHRFSCTNPWSCTAWQFAGSLHDCQQTGMLFVRWQ